MLETGDKMLLTQYAVSVVLNFLVIIVAVRYTTSEKKRKD